MDNSILYVFMIVLGILMAGMPYAILNLLHIFAEVTLENNYWSVFFTLLLSGFVVMYFTSAAAFSAIQYNNCKKVKASSIFGNAAVSAAIASFFTLLAGMVPFLRDFIKALMPLNLDSTLTESLAFGYYGFWGAMFGVVIGGSFSAICPT